MAQEPTPSKTNRIRHVRVEQTVWVLAARKAEREGLTISGLVRRLLTEYVKGNHD